MAWEVTDPGGGPANARSWPMVAGANRYAAEDAAIDDALRRRARSGELLEEIARLSHQVEDGRARLQWERREERHALPAAELAADMGRLLRSMFTPEQTPARGERARDRIERLTHDLERDEQQLATLRAEFDGLGMPGRDLRTAVHAKAARVVTDQAEGWRAVDTLVRDLAGVGERIEALEIAHDAIQRVLRGCAAVLSRYEAVRTAAVARSGADDERYQEAVSAAIRTTDTLRSDLGDARAALKKLRLPRRIRLRTRHRLQLRRARADYAPPVEQQCAKLKKTVLRLRKKATKAEGTVETVRLDAVAERRVAEDELTGVMKRPH